jgi:hypothetical protein
VASFGVWTFGVDCRAQTNFHCTPNFRNKIILTYLVISKFSVPWKFSKSLKKIIFKVKRMYAPDARRTPLTQRFIKRPNVLKPYSFSFSLIFLTPKHFQRDFWPSLCDFKRISSSHFGLNSRYVNFQRFPKFSQLRVLSLKS